MHECEALNIARGVFIEKTSELEFKTRYAEWKLKADTMFPGRYNKAWDKLPFEAAEDLSNAIMKAIADLEDLELVGELLSTKSKKPPEQLSDKIARHLAKAKAALDKDGMEVLT